MSYLKCLSLSLLVSLFGPMSPGAPGSPLGPRHDATGVGHGDVLELYLEATRLSLRDTVAKISQGEDSSLLCDCPAQEIPSPFCRVLQSLTSAERDYCRHFILATAPAMLRLTSQKPTTVISLRKDEILDLDPEGHLRPVIAKTKLGPEGDIVVNYQGISSLPPIAMLALLGHELGHKTKPPELADYIGDNEPAGPFDRPGGGRVLMDRVGAALATYAARHKIIGEMFNLEDYFQCKVREKSSPTALVVSGRSLRLFMGGGFEFYETGIGNIPQDISCEADDGESGVRLFYRVKIHEEHGCVASTTGPPAGRWTLLELWQIQPAVRKALAEPTRVESKLLAGWNPLCEKDPTASVLALEHRGLSGRQYRFEARFQKSEGKTRYLSHSKSGGN